MSKLKISSVAIVALFAIGAIAASAAMADDLTSESSPVRLTGTQVTETNNVFTVHGTGTASCDTALYTTFSVTTPTTTVPVTPTYSKCTVFGFPGEVHMNGCTYLLHLNGGGSTTATVDVVCPAGQEITITAISGLTTKCIIHVPTQTNLAKITGTNIGAGATREIEVHLEVEKIIETHTAGTGVGKCTAGGTNTATYSGTVKVTGEKTGASEHVGIFLS